MNFFRDRDANSDAFDNPRNDPTARSPSTSPRKKQKVTHIPGNQLSTDTDVDNAAIQSLRRRMAGPSSSKAGLAKDQDEINRIIYEVSKGSKFFENERKKDQQTTERINALLARKDEKLRQIRPRSPEWTAIQRRIDEMAAKLEESRDLSRVILHTDIDMFYAAVELARDPSLKGKCFGVGSGVLVTASYEARRGYGVRSGMATFVAKALCPELIVVKNDMASYVDASKKVMAVFEQYDENLAQASLDEAYLDVTEYIEQQEGQTVEDVVTQLREQVKTETQLTVSVGIAPNTMLAKISSDRNKPDGQYRVMPDRRTIVEFMKDLPCRKIPGIGRVNERILESMGVTTCGEIWDKRMDLWLALDGKIEWLLRAHLGLGNTVVEPAKREERKSVGREHTFSPTFNREMLLELLRESADRVEEDLKRLEFKGKTVTLKCKRDNFQRFSRAKTSTRPLYKADDLYDITSNLLLQEMEKQPPGAPLSLRLIGVSVTQLIDQRSAAAGSERFKKMFESASSIKRSDRATEEEEEERQLALAIQQSLEGVDPFNQVGDLSQDAAIAFDPPRSESTRMDPPSTAETLIQCPICSRKVASDNDQLNSHIDLCLSGAADDGQPASAPPASVQPKSRTKKKGPLDGFFQRSSKS